MNPELHQSLIHNTERLRDLIRLYSTESVVGMCSVRFYHWLSDSDADIALVSPFRQLFFLLGVLLTTHEPEPAQDFGDDAWNACVQLLNDIFLSYAVMYWPTTEELPTLSEEWRNVREVAMPAFLDYFNTGLTASVEQISERILRYLVPFNAVLTHEFGISATQSHTVTHWIAERLQQGADELQQAAEASEKVRKRLLMRAQKERWSLDKLRAEAAKPKNARPFHKLFAALDKHLKITLDFLEREFGSNIAQAYWNTFVSRRGSISQFTYLTEHNPAEDKPLFETATHICLCPFANALFAAVMQVTERQLLASSSRESFLRMRDRLLEDEVDEQFRRIFRTAADFYSHVYENADLHHEHDLIIKWDRKLFVIEAKASPPVEPFRDPERAFVRIKRAFQSETGVQRAFDQANRVLHKLSREGVIRLYSVDGNLLVELHRDDIDTVYTICVTRDNFGPLSVDLSLLLEKNDADPYPWAINIFDLTYMFGGWEYLGWGPDELCKYLDVRVRLHGKIISFDEIDLAGFFVQHGGLHHLLQLKADKIQLASNYSDVFDKMYSATKGGPPFTLVVTNPVVADIKEQLARIFPDIGSH